MTNPEAVLDACNEWATALLRAGEAACAGFAKVLLADPSALPQEETAGEPH